MAKVFDESGAIVDSGSDVVLNDLTQAPIHTTMPEGQSWLAIIVPAENGLKRVVLVAPDQIATMQSIQDIIDAVTVARQALTEQVLAKNTEQDTKLDDMARELASIVLTPGPAGKDGVNGKDGAKGATGDVGANGTKGADGAVGMAGGVGPIGPVGPRGDTGLTGQTGAVGLSGATGPQGATGAASTVAGPVGPQGPAGVPTRVERYSSFSTDVNGIVNITFNPAFTSIPDCDIVESWTNTTPPQQVVGSVTEVTLTGCKAQVMLSQGTLILNAAPFAKAGAGIKPIIRAIGK